PTYEVIRPFDGDFAKVALNKKWGIIDNKGNVVVNLEYDEIGNFSQNFVWAKKGSEFGIVTDNQFKPIVGVDKISDFGTNNLSIARKNNKLGFINKNGEWIIEPNYSNAKDFSNGLAPVEKNGKWGYIDESGEIKIPTKYNDAELFSDNGLAPVKQNGKWGFVNKQGELVIPTEYDISVSFGFMQKDKGFNGNIARVKKQGKWSFIDNQGKVIADKWFDNAELFND
ncbi:WG repeat-containing protein, partial [Algoriella sp.]